MGGHIILNHGNIDLLVRSMSQRVLMNFARKNPIKVYAIPRGGIPVAYLLRRYVDNISIVDHPDMADCFIDDLIDSGKTTEAYRKAYGAKPFYTLFDKRDPNNKFRGKWVVFPWEQGATDNHETIEHNIQRLLQYMGEDVNREGLRETPARVAKAWRHWCSGYDKSPADVLKVFEDGAEGYDQMIVRKDIIIHSKCEHHLADIFGTCTVAYIPSGKIVGLSKIDRLVDIFARRLQVQERLTCQIADALMEHLQPLGVGVYINARHMCLESRGVGRANSETVTTALRGVIKESDAARAEFLAITK